MTRIAILGATGYTALELIKILLRHPEAEIVAVTSRQEGQPPVAMIHPSLEPAGSICGWKTSARPKWPPGRNASSVACRTAPAPRSFPLLLDAGARVVDFSADYRLNDAEVYAQWYGQKHADPGRLGKVVYGLPELFRRQIPPARLVANPGCYPTSAILPLAPLLKAGLIEPQGIIVDSKSGVSGAGRTPKLTTLFPECNESISAYNVGRHRHTPEIEQMLGTAAGAAVEVIFTPQLVPMDRGILTTTYSQPTGPDHRGKGDADARAISTPTSRLSAWSITCREPRTRPTRTSATSRPAWSAAAC